MHLLGKIEAFYFWRIWWAHWSYMWW